MFVGIGTSKIQGTGRGVFAAKSFDKDEMISVHIKKKQNTLPLTLWK